MAAASDDFGEVYTGGQAGGNGFTEDSEDPYLSGAATSAAPVASGAAGEVLVFCCYRCSINKIHYLENEDDIYGFTENG